MGITPNNRFNRNNIFENGNNIAMIIPTAAMYGIVAGDKEANDWP